MLVASDLPASNVAAASNQSPDTVEVIHYEPKVVRLSAEAATPAVLLLNDHYDPDWKVFVDNKQGTLLRCNYIARGVFLEPGRHTVEFRFEPSTTTLKISLMGFAIGILVCGFLAFSKEPASAPATKPDPAPRTAKPANRSRK